MIPLQSSACSINEWATQDWFGCIFGSATAATGGEPLFGLLVGGVVITTLYFAGNGDVVAPSVVTMLLGGILVPALPGGMVGVAYAITFLGAVSALMAVGRRYVLSPGSQRL